MTGIAAVVPGKQRRIRDILVAERVLDLSEFKVFPKKDEARPLLIECDFQLLRCINENFPSQKHARIHVGLLISQRDLIKSARKIFCFSFQHFNYFFFNILIFKYHF